MAAPDARDGTAVDDAHYNLEASVRIASDDDFGREHLLRYCARPPLSLARLTELPHGKLGYRIKKLRNHRNKLRIMTPLELLARLAALIPPPRHPLVRFHGAFAPRSSWRKLVVPKPPQTKPEQTQTHNHHKSNDAAERATPHVANTARKPPTALAPSTPGLIAETESMTPNMLSIRHWERLRSGALIATSPHVDWSTLMSRTFDVDVLECPKCKGRLRILAIVDNEALAKSILDDLAIARAPPPLRARDAATLDHDPDADDTC
jgi:hypothetical protein